MNYIFCGAYRALLFALYIKNVLKENITIITNNNDIVEYCISENIEYIKFECIRSTVFPFLRIFTLKKILDKTIAESTIGKNDSFFLQGYAKGYDFFYLAKELTKKSNGFYKAVDTSFLPYKPLRYTPFYIRGEITRAFFKLIMGLDLVYYSSAPGNPCLGIDKNFLKKYNIEEYAKDTDIEKILFDAIRKSKNKYGEYDNLIIDQGPDFNTLKFDSVKSYYEKLLELPQSFAIKKHPNPSLHKSKIGLAYYDIFKNCQELPRFIPVELFCNNIKNSAISIYSTALLAISKFEHIKAISTIQLVDWYDDEQKKHFKDYLEVESNNKIIFPNDFEELKEILLNKN